MLEARGATIPARIANVSARFEAGKVTAICGPNGAGKSSLLAALAGLERLSAGEVLLHDSPLQHMSPRERAKAIGFLPQSAEGAWDVPVSVLVALGRLPYGGGGGEAVEAALHACKCDLLAHRPISTLSGGEKARAFLARVLAGEPEWILADEPFAALDIAQRISIMAVLKGEAAKGRGVIMVVHDLAFAMNHADTIVVMDKGELVADGTGEAALSSEIIARVWGVDARWLGEKGAQALMV